MTDTHPENSDGEQSPEREQPLEEIQAQLDEHRRKHGGEDVVAPRSDDPTTYVSMDAVIERVFEHFDHVAGITVKHPLPTQPTSIDTLVTTNDAYTSGDVVNLYDSGRTYLLIENTDGERFAAPFEILATSTVPEVNVGAMQTAVFRAETGLGSESTTVGDGLERLRAKIGSSYDEILEMLHSETT
jgi:hypothetical protein